MAVEITDSFDATAETWATTVNVDGREYVLLSVSSDSGDACGIYLDSESAHELAQALSNLSRQIA